MTATLTNTTQDAYGSAPQIDAESSSLTPTPETKHAINSPSQALSVCYRLREDWIDGIKNSAAITAQLNGQRPRDPVVLENLGRNWLPNINAGILRIEAGKVPARLWKPINTATYLTASHLPSNWPNGVKKTGIFREKVTSAIRSWRKWPWFMRQLAREVGFFGFGYSVHFEKYDWHPTFVRQDRGFAPMGWEILEDELPLFMVAYSYQPFDLLTTVRESLEAGLKHWNKDAVARAINASGPKPADGSDYNSRSYEEMIRNASIGWTYEKGYNKIETYHLFSTDADGTVSHHVVLASDLNLYAGGRKSAKVQQPVNEKGEPLFMFEYRGQFEKMSECVTPVLFDPDDGTIQGSWGAGQMLFDLSIEAEKTANDWMASLKQMAKIKVQAGDGKNPDEVRLHVDDAMMVLENGTYAGNTAAVTTDPKPFQALLESLSQLAREKIGSYIPPIPLQPSDIKAAQINAKEREQQDVREQIFETWLWQFALVIENIVRRLCAKGSPDEVAKDLRKELLLHMNDDELELLVEQHQIETIFEFTELAQAKRAMFAAQKVGNAFYNQKELERIQAQTAGGQAFAESILIPGDDATVEAGARRWQAMETATMSSNGQALPVLPEDQDWYHMLELRPVLTGFIEQGVAEVAIPLLNHYRAHYVGAVAKQMIPKEKINPEKSFIAKAGKAIETGQLPNDGFEDQVDLVEQAQAQMGSQSPTTRGPTEPEVAVA